MSAPRIEVGDTVRSLYTGELGDVLRITREVDCLMLRVEFRNRTVVNGDITGFVLVSKATNLDVIAGSQAEEIARSLVDAVIALHAQLAAAVAERDRLRSELRDARLVPYNLRRAILEERGRLGDDLESDRPDLDVATTRVRFHEQAVILLQLDRVLTGDPGHIPSDATEEEASALPS